MQAPAATDIRLSSIAEMREHGGELFRQHWDEIALNRGLMVLDPDWRRYELLEECGHLLCLAAWDGDVLAGYSVTIITAHPHYRHLVCANNDVLFVAKPYRLGRLGTQLIEATANHVRERGARLLLWHAKQGTPLEALLCRLGYGVQDVIYAKEV